MSATLHQAIESLDPKAVSSRLAANAAAATAKPVLVHAFCSWTKARHASLRSGRSAMATLMSKFDQFMQIAKLLLDAGASPRGTIPAQFCKGLNAFSGESGCSLPIEAAACLMEPALSLPLVQLLLKHGSQLDGLCDGACVAAGCTAMKCGALSCSLRSAMADLPPQYLAKLDNGAATLVDRELMSLLLQHSGAGSVEIDATSGRMTAAQGALFPAILYQKEHVVTALLAAGVSGDFTVVSPPQPGVRATRMHALWVAAEEATNEAIGGAGQTMQDIRTFSREYLLRIRRQRQHDYKGGPAIRILRAILAAGCPDGLKFRKVSGRTGEMTSVLLHPTQNGASEVVQELLKAGADPEALSSEADPAPCRLEFPAGVETPLEAAASWGHLDLVRMYIAAGARAGRSPRALAIAAAEGFDDIVTALLEAPGGHSVLEQQCAQPLVFQGLTPLMVAALKQQPSSVALLLAAGANALPSPAALAAATASHRDVDDPRSRLTPMACAIFGGASSEIISALVAAGAAQPALQFTGAGGRGGSATFQSRTGERVPHADAGAVVFRLVCDGCGKQPSPSDPPLMLCGRCKVSRYCSRECQRAAWKMHSKDCAAPKS